MNGRLAAILFFRLVLALPIYAAPSTDVLVMKNGDHLTCQIKGLNGGVLYVGLPYVIETLSVDWSQVARLESRQLFLVKTVDGSVYRGRLDTEEREAGRPIAIKVSVPQQKNVVLESASIVEVTLTSEKFHQRFTGGVSFGSIFTKA